MILLIIDMYICFINVDIDRRRQWLEISNIRRE